MLAIRNYGHLWDRDGVFWGRSGKGNEGHLVGLRGKTEVNFREQIAIYVLYDTLQNPIYVGQVGFGEESRRRLFSRLRNHHREGRMHWRYFSWFGLRGVNPKSPFLSDHHRPDTGLPKRKLVDGLNEIEAVLIQVLNPRSNRRGGNWQGAKRFRQILDARLIDIAADDTAIFEMRLLQRQLRKIQIKLGIPEGK